MEGKQRTENIAIIGLPHHFDQCLNCGGNDGSFTLSAYGLCLKCGHDIYGPIGDRPNEILLAATRVLIFMLSQRRVKDAPRVEIT